MILYSVIVAYHPSSTALVALALTLIADGSQVLIVDNTPRPQLREEDFPPECRLLPLSANMGIAYAQNVGIKAALAEGAEVVALFDQDSEPDAGFLRRLLAGVNLTRPELVAPVCLDERSGAELPSYRLGSRMRGLVEKVYSRNARDPVDVDLAIASGSAATAPTFAAAGLMDEDLFIDFVDFEWCLRCRAKGVTIKVVPTATMRHAIGERAVPLGVMNGVVHSSARSYYKIRNGFLLFRKKHVPLSYAWRETTVALLQYLLLLPFVKQRLLYVKVFLRAVGHGLGGVTGRDPASPEAVRTPLAAPVRISVCMATYNGERFVAEQMASILAELAATDEVVVVDDGSTDGTWHWLQDLSDPRVKIYRNERNCGVNATFARAMSLAEGDVIFLSDQDDRWAPGRVATFVGALAESGALLASSNMSFMDGEGRPTRFRFDRLAAGDSTRFRTNILRIFLGRAGYFGCAMAFRRKLRDLILPLPGVVESHDLWMAMASNLARSNVHVEADTLVRRIHGGNASVVQRSMLAKVRSRLVFAWTMALLLTRRRKFCRQLRRDIL